MDEHYFLPAEVNLHMKLNLHDQLVNDPQDKQPRNTNFNDVAALPYRIPYTPLVAACPQSCYRIVGIHSAHYLLKLLILQSVL